MYKIIASAPRRLCVFVQVNISLVYNLQRTVQRSFSWFRKFGAASHIGAKLIKAMSLTESLNHINADEIHLILINQSIYHFQ